MAKKVKNRAAAKDFTAEMLPHDRKRQFFNILKNRMPLILKSAIIIFVFFIPFILAASYKTRHEYKRRQKLGVVNISEHIFVTYRAADILLIKPVNNDGFITCGEYERNKKHENNNCRF